MSTLAFDSAGRYEKHGYGLSTGSAYYEWLYGKTLTHVRGFHTTDGSVIGLVFEFADGSTLHIEPFADAGLRTGE